MVWLVSFLCFTQEFAHESHLIKVFCTVTNDFSAFGFHILARIIYLLQSIIILGTLYSRLEVRTFSIEWLLVP